MSLCCGGEGRKKRGSNERGLPRGKKAAILIYLVNPWMFKQCAWKMNTAYVPSAFYRRLVCQEGDGTCDYLSSQADDVCNAFLHFKHHDTLSPSPTGTLVRIIPIDDSQSVDSLNQDDDIEESVHLHPLLIKVLIALGRDKVETDVYHDNSAHNDRHQVLISSWDERGDDAGTLGWLELINPIMNSNRNGSLIPIAIHLTYICSTTSRGRDCFRNKQNNDIMNAGTGKNEFLMKLLAGQVVTEGSVIGIDIGEKFDDDDDYYYNNELLHREDMVFFMVNKIVTTDGSIINAKYLYLEPGQQFDVLLNADCSNVAIDNPQPKTQWNNCKCPGYESILDELLTLTKISNPNGSPTAVILSGCSGVGKSRMVWFTLLYHLT